MKLLKKRLKEWIRTHSTPDKIVYELPENAEQNQAFSMTVLEMLEHINDDEDDEKPEDSAEGVSGLFQSLAETNQIKRRAERKRKREECVRALPTNWLDPASFCHYCPYGCCQSLEESVEKIFGYLCYFC